MISIISAVAQNLAIGKDNQLLWNLPDDLKRFKKLTTGNTIIMGKKTFLSLPKRPLPNRTNIVISDIKDEVIDGCTMAYSIDDVLSKIDHTKENFIIGGGSIYNQFINKADILYITWVYKNFDADVYFPKIDLNIYREKERIDINDPKIGFSYSFSTYGKII